MYITFFTYLVLIIFGLCLGSFAGASVWRLRASQLFQDKKDGEDYDKVEYKFLEKLTKKSIAKDRSCCLHCSYELHWYDLVPLISWIVLKGKCRKCHKSIGYFEPLMELGVMAFFVISYTFWPYQLSSALEIARLAIWLVSGVALAILFAYDKKWFMLPDSINYALVGVGIINAIMIIINSSDRIGALFSIVGAVLVLSGLYFVLYVISKGKWIGFGDIKLGLGLALLLADWELAVIALFAANLIGCIIVIPSMISGRLKRDSRVPFGPLLIVGTFISLLAGSYLIGLYINCLY